MKKEIKVIFFSLVLSLIFIGLISVREVIFANTSKVKEYVLVGLLLLIQTQILKGLKSRLMDLDSSLIKVKRKLYLFYTQTAVSFQTLYESVSKRNQYHEVLILLADLGFTEIDEETHALGQKWLNKEEKIPFQNLPKKIKLWDRLKVKGKIEEYHVRSAQKEDVFFDCLSGKLVSNTASQSIVELILVWVSYFYFLIGVFGINPSDHTDLFITFFAITIADIGKHYFDYRKEVDTAKEVLENFHGQMCQMQIMMHDKDCVYVNVQGEQVPYM